MIRREQLDQVLETFKGIPQEPSHHAEGDVYNHTLDVLAALESDPEYMNLDEADKVLMYSAAALHDIGKKMATKLVDGHWSSPKHGSIGSRLARKLLWKDFRLSGSEDAYEFREALCSLIFTHCMPTHFMTQRDQSPEFIVQKLASIGCQFKRFSLKKLSMLVRADLNGRTANDRQHWLDVLSLFVDTAKELGCYENPPKFIDDFTRFRWLNSKVNDFTFSQFDDTWGTAYLTVGFPGTGKSSWIKKNFPEVEVISLDNLRKELGLKSNDNQGKLLQVAFEKARCSLRGHKACIWDATCLTPDFRRKQLGLFHDYHAKSRILWFETSWDEEMRRNSSRDLESRVPEDVISDMLGRFQPPDLSDAVSIEHIIV